MSEEEKQAIEFLKDSINVLKENSSIFISNNYKRLQLIEAYTTILNLIDKQRKEIEELKEIEWKVLEIITDTNDNLEGMFIKLIKLFVIPKEKVKTNCISKDKIKAKIEKEEKYQETTKKLFPGSLNYHIQEYAIEVLKELLEE